MIRIKSIIPSVLSATRLLIAIAFPFSPEKIWLGLILAAGVSDVLDGYLARKWNATSWQGGLIDAIADKLFVLTVLIVYAVSGKFSPYWIPLVISRDLVVLFTAVYIATIRLWGSFKKMSAKVSGKMATGGQFILFLTVLLTPENTRYALLFASFCSLFAACDYTRLFSKALVERSMETNSS